MSSKRGLRRKKEKRQCRDKARYISKLTALIHNRKRKDDCFAYKCEFCGYWHLGHNESIRQEIYERKQNK